MEFRGGDIFRGSQRRLTGGRAEAHRPRSPGFPDRDYSVLIDQVAGLQSLPSLDPRALEVWLPRFPREGAHRFLDPGREFARSFLRRRRHGLSDAYARRSGERQLLTARHDLVGAANVQRHDRRAGLVCEGADPGLRLLDAGVGLWASRWITDQVRSWPQLPA